MFPIQGLEESLFCRKLQWRLLARACGVPVGRRSGGRLAMTLVATNNVIIFSTFFNQKTFAGVAGGERVPPAALVWYFFYNSSILTTMNSPILQGLSSLYSLKFTVNMVNSGGGCTKYTQLLAGL